MAGLLLIVGSALAADCDPSNTLDEARDASLALDLDGGHAKLEEAENLFGCGVASSKQIAEFWIITAALASFEGDEAARDEALHAARAADDMYWIDSFGEELKSTWANLEPPTGTAKLTLTDLPERYEVRVDGKPRDGAVVEFSPGLHVIQASGGDHVFGRVMGAVAGDDISLPTGLPELPPPVAVAVVEEPEPTKKPKKPKKVKEPKPPREPKLPREPGDLQMFALHAGVGLGALVGPGFEVTSVTEPGAKFGPLLEVGVLVRPADGVWARAAIGADFALGGRFVYLDGDDAGKAMPLAPGLLVSGGVTVIEKLDVGGMLGMQLPSRIPVRAVGAYALTDLIKVEGRLGVNLIGEKTVVAGERSGSVAVEPALAVLGTFTY